MSRRAREWVGVVSAALIIGSAAYAIITGTLTIEAAGLAGLGLRQLGHPVQDQGGG